MDLAKICDLITEEYGDAAEVYGRYNNSNHESYSVIREEVEEALEDIQRIGEDMEEFWKLCRNDKEKLPSWKKEVEDVLTDGEYWSTELIKEAVQVAAMFRKAAYTADELYGVSNWLNEAQESEENDEE